MRYRFLIGFFLWTLIFSGNGWASGPEDYFKIKVVDAASGLGVPMVELKTMHHLRYFSDSNGYIAFHEPGLMNQEIYFLIRGQGYDYPQDWLGSRGVALKCIPGDSAVVSLRRTVPAERLYRVTGAGIYRDSHLLDIPTPLKQPLMSGKVFGQDSNLSLIFDGKIYWFWGDTFRPNYPLGNFAVSAATSELPGKGGLDPDSGVDLQYFVDSTGFSKKMIELQGEGLVWFDWVAAIPDNRGGETLAAKYARVRLDFTNFDRGIAVFNPANAVFETLRHVPEWMPDYHSTVHPIQVQSGGRDFYYFTSEFHFQRAAPVLDSLAKPAAYQSFSCLKPGAAFDATNPQIERDDAGNPVWGWKKNSAAIDIYRHKTLLDSGHISPEQGWLHLTDIAGGGPLQVNRGSLNWNAYRARWVMIAGGAGMGDVWYAEADTPLGPWVFGRKVAVHDKHLYNPVHHRFFDKAGGRQIYFEGTYTNAFTKAFETPRYEYNQIMYRLQLDDPQMFLPAPLYEVATAAGRADYHFAEALPENSISETALNFMAYQPGRHLAGMVPVYKQMKGETAILSTRKSGKPLFYALPAQPEKFERLKGSWNCTATDDVFFTRQFSLTFKSDGEQLTAAIDDPGFLLSDFQHRADSIFFNIVIFDKFYQVAGKVAHGRLSGQWHQLNAAGKMLDAKEISAKGNFSGELADYQRFPAQHRLLKPLYEYRERGGKGRRYGTDDLAVPANYQRSGQPLCRVWAFPGAALIHEPDVRQTR